MFALGNSPYRSVVDECEVIHGLRMAALLSIVVQIRLICTSLGCMISLICFTVSNVSSFLHFPIIYIFLVRSALHTGIFMDSSDHGIHTLIFRNANPKGRPLSMTWRVVSRFGPLCLWAFISFEFDDPIPFPFRGRRGIRQQISWNSWGFDLWPLLTYGKGRQASRKDFPGLWPRWNWLQCSSLCAKNMSRKDIWWEWQGIQTQPSWNRWAATKTGVLACVIQIQEGDNWISVQCGCRPGGINRNSDKKNMHEVLSNAVVCFIGTCVHGHHCSRINSFHTQHHHHHQCLYASRHAPCSFGLSVTSQQ